MSNFFAGGRPLPRRRTCADPRSRTTCRCGREHKEVWALLGRECWLRLPLELRSQLTLRKHGKTVEERRGAVRDAFTWLDEHPDAPSDLNVEAEAIMKEVTQ